MKPLKLHNPYKRRKRVFWPLLISVCLLFLFFSLSKTSDSFYRLSFPVQKSLSYLGSETSFFTRYFFKANEIKKENQRLEKERNDLVIEILVLREIEKENQRLREALDLGLEKDFSLILASVSSFDVFHDSFLINKGSQDGVLQGMAAITSKKVLIGRIIEAEKSFSRVLMISHKESPFFDASIQGQETTGIVKGKGNFKLELDLIDKETDLEENKVVVTMGEIFPKGLFVGLIKKTHKTDAEPFQKAEIQLLFNPRTIEKVFVIK